MASTVEEGNGRWSSAFSASGLRHTRGRSLLALDVDPLWSDGPTAFGTVLYSLKERRSNFGAYTLSLRV
jgi:hypothetical protein